MPANDSLHGRMARIAFGAALACAVPWAMANGIQSAVQTVDQLLQAEHEKLSNTARGGPAAAQAAATAPAQAVVKAPSHPVDIQVRAIYGVGRLTADLAVNGHAADGIPAGAIVEGCRIVAIQDRCVTMEPAFAIKGRKATSQCPARACWTGIDPLAAIAAQRAAAPAAVGQMPAGAPSMPAAREPQVVRQPIPTASEQPGARKASR